MTAVFAGCAEDLAREAFKMQYRLAEVQPIECYVRFVDQNGQPVANVAVDGLVWSNDPGRIVFQSKKLNGLTTTDDGQLHIVGERGGFLRLAVNDPRYLHGDVRPGSFPGNVLRFTQNSSVGSARHGTKNHPASYQAWRKEGPQSLISLSGELRVTYTEASFRLDLVKGELVNEGGDLLIESKMPETDEERRKAADRRGIIPASFTIKFVDGGLLSEQGDASEYGYASEYDFASGIMASEFPSSELTDQLIRFKGFFTLRGGMVSGKMKLNVGAESVANGGQGRIIIRINECLLNPNGSRSLEPDPDKLIKLTLTDARKK
jgi:hypothetical protein